MVIGRVIEIEGNDPQKLLFSQQRHQLLSEAISNNPELADVLSQYPLWSLLGENNSVLANDQVVDDIKSGVIYGLWDETYVPEDPDDLGIHNAY
ncbi:hypothetical protein SAMN03080615_01953 [Amphritea atlantica]|uniref:Uncharacterized protein n=2 Tax=Amphritea atlantica TaxID=355243 RepID=A0A1H9H5V5_9GAMM|nr:hypothetical protein SAMN03080615_01953 [Amphritea atlantica]